MKTKTKKNEIENQKPKNKHTFFYEFIGSFQNLKLC